MTTIQSLILRIIELGKLIEFNNSKIKNERISINQQTSYVKLNNMHVKKVEDLTKKLLHLLHGKITVIYFKNTKGDIIPRIFSQFLTLDDINLIRGVVTKNPDEIILEVDNIGIPIDFLKLNEIINKKLFILTYGQRFTNKQSNQE